MLLKINKFLTLLLLGVFVLSFVSVLSSKELDGAQKITKPDAITGLPTRTILNICNWTYWIRYDGESAHTPAATSGGIFPKGTAGAFYLDGFIIGVGHTDDGGQINPRIGGSSYRIGTTPGYINAAGVAVDASDPEVRMYRIRKDWEQVKNNPGMVVADAQVLYQHDSPAQVTDAELAAVVAQYETDWNEWPVHLGAPYYDNNDNGVYDTGDEPGIASADQVVWFVVNDSDDGATNTFHACPPIGFEEQVTLWGYAHESATLGQMLFKKFKIINKSGVDLTDVYFAQWCDPDLGDYGDDLAGCDTLLSLGFGYNEGANDTQYDDFGLVPPAVGYDFFQGPIQFTGVSTDTAVFNLNYVSGALNMPMTTFLYFAAGAEYSDPALGSYQGAKAWWNLLRGFAPLEDIDDPTPWHEGNTVTEPITVFPLAGDPETQTGDVDGTYMANLQGGDRRMGLATGPFNMAPGEVQEVVIAVVGGLGTTNLNSVTVMKQNDATAQAVYNTLFDGIPSAPASPAVQIVKTEDQILLDWGSNATAVASTEDHDKAGYLFEGYNLYQLPYYNSQISEGTRIGTWDIINGVTTIESPVRDPNYGAEKVLVPVQFGVDSGLRRFFVIEKDYLTNGPLYKGSEYYFAVTAYNYNATPSLIEDRTLESALLITTIIPQALNPGDALGHTIGEVMTPTHSVGTSDGLAEVNIVNPENTTGDNYEITFELFDHIVGTDTTEVLGWNVTNVTTGTAVIEDQLQTATLDERGDQPIVEGFQVKVAGPPVAVNDWHYTSGTVSPLYPTYDRGRWFSGNAGGTGIFGGLYISENFQGSSIAAADLKPVDVHFTHMTGYTDTDGSGTWDPLEVYTFDTAEGCGAFMHSTWGAGNYMGFYDVPFQAFDVSDPANPRQLNIFMRDWDGDTQWELESDDTPYNYVWILATDYDATGALHDPGQGAVDLMINYGGDSPGYYVYRGVPRGSREFLAESGVLNIIPNYIITETDEYTFSTTAPTVNNTALALADIEKINAFPNPYVGYNSNERNRFDQFITFTHLPAQATLRIFTLGGSQVRKMEKDDASAHFNWDLLNDAGVLCASGLYIVHIDMPELGKEKVLKVFIVQREQYIKYY